MRHARSQRQRVGHTENSGRVSPPFDTNTTVKMQLLAIANFVKLQLADMSEISDAVAWDFAAPLVLGKAQRLDAPGAVRRSTGEALQMQLLTTASQLPLPCFCELHHWWQERLCLGATTSQATASNFDLEDLRQLEKTELFESEPILPLAKGLYVYRQILSSRRTAAAVYTPSVGGWIGFWIAQDVGGREWCHHSALSPSNVLRDLKPDRQ